ncbi:MAG TPA: glutathione peroxidase [Burkholderiales bacterium]|jgi:glutathione peroxidase|nr:glutathione peroxidase [Burkholderiales bacterium]
MRTALRRLAPFVLMGAAMTAAACPGLLDQKMETLTGDDASLCKYAGSVLLVVNTASRCGYTPQYDGLEKLYRKYKGKGLVVLGFPSNDFGAQEPGSAQEIAKFCEQNYGVTFPMFAKTSVSAGAVNPFYEKLATVSGSRPRWNFHKYLVDRRGIRVVPFDTKVAPQDPKFIAEIERLLAER